MGIDKSSIFADFKMQMRTGGIAAIACCPDDLP